MTSALSFLQNVSSTLLETILAGLVPLFLKGAKGNLADARATAGRMLAQHLPETEDEFRIAAEIVGLSFQSIAAVGEAAQPDQTPARTMQLRRAIVSLSRGAERAEKRLRDLQKRRMDETARRPAPSPRAQPEPKPQTEKPAPAAKISGTNWIQVYQHLQRDHGLIAPDGIPPLPMPATPNRKPLGP